MLPQSLWTALALGSIVLLTRAAALSPAPADHLVPPPLPTPQRLTHNFAPAAQPAAETLRPPPPPPPSAVEVPGPGFMTRVARWFGLGDTQQPREQQLSPSSITSYVYPKPGQGYDGKPCSLCNKYPWVPMMSAQLQQQTPWQQQPQLEAQASQYRQRAVQFAAPPPPPPPHQSLFLPIPVPGLSSVAMPPIYSAQPFRPLLHLAAAAQTPVSSTSAPAFTAQQLPTTQPARFTENVGAHSELRVTQLPASTLPPPTSHYSNRHGNNNFEIVQSHQLTDFVTSVEYPATFVQSHAIDLGLSNYDAPSAAATMPTNHKQLDEPEISTVRYQLEDLHSSSLSQHVPASQLLTELGHFTASTQLPEQTTNTPPSNGYTAAEQETQTAPPQYYEPPAADNYPAASSQQHQQHGNFASWHEYVELPTSTTTSVPTLYEHEEYTTPEPAPAAELNNHLSSSGTQSYTLGIRQRGRETPKRLLDAPIKYGQAGPPPRPFTRDPAELNFRLAQLYTPAATKQPSQPPVTQAPTPTSTYGAIDASGQYAGMAPPSPQQVVVPYTTKNKPRPFEPTRAPYHGWTHKKQVRTQAAQANDVELHEQQESKLVSTATAPPPPNTRRTTKYLTKILASNLRELLKRERENKSRPIGSALGVDIAKLQKNIDGWTEQEYTSLSHRPSTPTIRGRSKHIPTEYLTTTVPTPTARRSKTTYGGFELGGSATTSDNEQVGDLSTSINNLEQRQRLVSSERGSKHFQYVSPVVDNHLVDYYEAHKRISSTPLPSVSTTTAPQKSHVGDKVTPLYVRGALPTQTATELWKKAKVSISPQTNEKVYVVTPQPRHLSYDAHTVAPTGRFLVRPTPGREIAPAPTPTMAPQPNYTPDIFGLMGLSSYVPADPVEIIDGNSKVIKIVTPAPKAEALQRQLTAKPTMSPTPR